MLLEDELKAKGHEVLIAYDGQAGIELSKQEPDLIILDIMMPKMNGFEVCQAIRDDVLCPIIFLSAKQSETDKIKGLTFGGDDYVTKPFGLRELMASVELLALHAGQVFSREQIYEKVWGCDSEGDSSTVVERVKKIRAKFSAVTPEKEYISTVWGIGYKWNKM